MFLTTTHAGTAGIRESLDQIGAFIGAVSATAPLVGFPEGKGKNRMVFADIAKFLIRVATATQLEPETC